MIAEKKPLNLKEELSRLVREASPGAWINDAHLEIENWRQVMPGASRANLHSVLNSSDERLELRGDDGWTGNAALALYCVERDALCFYSGQALNRERVTFASEQEFIAHLLALLSHVLNLSAR